MSNVPVTPRAESNWAKSTVAKSERAAPSVVTFADSGTVKCQPGNGDGGRPRTGSAVTSVATTVPLASRICRSLVMPSVVVPTLATLSVMTTGADGPYI